MRFIYLLFASLLFTSCIPLSIAPDLREGKVLKAKKFIKNLPKQYTYAFEDPKDANEFYHYINAKYQTEYDDDIGNTPVVIAGRTCYLTFYEVEKSTQTVNLIPIMINSALEEKGHTPILEDAEVSRVGTWYIALTVTDDNLKDCLNPSYDKHEDVLRYMQHLQNEYLSTKEYIEIYLKSSQE